MTNTTPRLKRTLLAGAFAAAAVGGTAATGILSDGDVAFAEPVRVDDPASPADFREVVKKVTPAVVSVRVRSEARPTSFNGMQGFEGFPGMEDLPEDHPFNRFFRRFGEEQGRQNRQRRRPRFDMGQGSGFFITEDGYLVTNQHVISGGRDYTIVMDDGTEYDAELIGADERTDLALLKVDADRDFTYVAFSDAPVEVGSWVLAVGNPFGLGGTVTAGIVSALGRDIRSGPYDDYIQIDAPVNRGNSGGPTFNTRGEVVGVNTAIFSPSGGNVGIAFAVPANVVKTIVNDLREDGTVVRGWLGVQIQPVTEDIAASLGLAEENGALVTEPQPDSPAEDAGILAGDVIIAVDDREVEGPRDLARIIADYAPDTAVDLTILRDDEERSVEVALGKLPERQRVASRSGRSDERDATPRTTSLGDLGLSLAPSEDGEGVMVNGIDDDSPALDKGIDVGDRIIAVAGDDVRSVDDVVKRVEAVKDEGKKAVLMRVENDRGTRFVALPFART